MGNKRLDEAERLLDKYSCQCGSGGGMACEDDCPGDITNDSVKEALRLVITEMREGAAHRREVSERSSPMG